MSNLEISKNNSKRPGSLSWNLLSEISGSMAIVFIDIYKNVFSNFLSAMFGVRCRFTPTCSCYARDAIRMYGLRRGSTLAAKRLLKCHPWGRGGHDPVVQPEKINEEAYKRGI